MSLLDTFLTEGLLITVARQDVYIAVRTDGAVGSGTVDDPWDGSTAAKFDDIMANKVSGGMTIHLGPGTFETNGFNLGTGAGWKPKSGQRILGTGMNQTTLKLANNAANGASLVLVGNKNDTDYLYGFEVSDLTLDCNLGNQQANSTAGAIALTGRNVYLLRLRAINWGTTATGGSAAAISLVRGHLNNPLPPKDCVLAACQVDPPLGVALNRSFTCVELVSDVPATGSVMRYHEACVVRECLLDAGTASPEYETRGLVIRGALGAIVERNRILNCTYGGPYELESSMPATEFYRNKDLVVWGNYYYNVLFGVWLKTREKGFGRVIVDRNWIELAVNSGAVGVIVDRVGGGTNAVDQLIARRNRFQHKDGGSSPLNGPLGLSLRYVGEAIVGRNLVDLGVLSNPATDNAVWHLNCGKVSCFNNRTSKGLFLPGYDEATQKHDPEFTTDVEDTLIAL
jgi:hypothetical protein